jgi:hypothetical protein
MLSYQIDSARRIVMVTGTGTLTAAEIVDVQNRVRADPAFDPMFALLSDYRLVASFELSAAEVRAIAATTPFHPSAKRSLVMADQLGLGMARMFQAYSELALNSTTLKVFRDDIDAAMAWLTEGKAT